MRIAIAQLNTCAGDFSSTVERMELLSKRAADQGAQLLVFPLAALTGTLPVDYASQQGYLIDLRASLEHLAANAACPCLVPFVRGMVEDVRPDAVLIQDGSLTPLERLEAADGLFSFGEAKLAVAFSYDDINRLIDESVSPDALVFVSGYGYALDDPGSALGAALLENRFRADAGSLDAWVVGVGSLGGYGTQVFAGASFVLAPWGELAASAPAFEEDLLVCEMDVRSEGPLDDPVEPELYNRSLHLWECLALGLRDYVGKLGSQDVVMALDGRLESCLLAALATDALGPTHVHALLAAGSPDALASARSIATALRMDLVEGEGETKLPDFAISASVGRLAHDLGAVPLSAEDKTYLALEVTWDVCRCAALLPFGDVYRSDVIELAHMRNTISPVIPATCFRAFDVPDVVGLANEERTPESCLRRVDVTLASHVEWERTLTDTIARQGSPELTERILCRLREREAARLAWPPCLVASSRTLLDARLPLGLRWVDRARTQEERLRASLDDSRMQAPEPRDLPDLSGLLEGLDSAAIERSVGDLLGLLQDLMQSDEMPEEGPFNPLTWGGPFSEN